MTAAPGRAIRDGLSYRPVQPHELEACAEVWRVVHQRLHRPAQPAAHRARERAGHPAVHAPAIDRPAIASSPRPGRTPTRRVASGSSAFASAVVRERLWFLSMCFVLPGAAGQRRRPGTARPGRPDRRRRRASAATAADSAQPIATRSTPRSASCRGSRCSTSSACRVGRRPSEPCRRASGRSRSSGSRPRAMSVSSRSSIELDRATLGVRHPDRPSLSADRESARLAVRGSRRRPPLGLRLRGRGRSCRVRSPAAIRDLRGADPRAPHSTRSSRAGAFAMWLPGTADRAVVGALRAGFRLEPFPVLLCWDRPLADLSRYLPISPGLL